MNTRLLAVLAAIAVLVPHLRADDTDARTWTDKKGRQVVAVFGGIEGGSIALQTADGAVHRFPLTELSEEDQKIARTLKPAPLYIPTSTTVAQAAAKMDELINRKLVKQGIQPNAPCNDEEFLRRAYLDIAGRIPNHDEATAFLADVSPTKRAKLIDQLLDSPGYTSHLYNYFADMLRVRDPDRGGDLMRAQPYIDWLKEQIANNRPYNEMVHEMLSATGKMWDNGATGYLLRDSGMTLDNLANTFSIFLGTDVACAQCHDHPFSDWTQMQFYQLAAFFGATSTRTNNVQTMNGDPQERIMAELTAMNADQAKKAERIVGDIIDANRFEVRDLKENRLRLPMDYKYKDGKPGEPVRPKFISWGRDDRGADAYRENRAKKEEKLRHSFAGWLTHPTNPRFAITIANRMWQRAFGLGVAEPVRNVDDPQSSYNPDLLLHLGKEMVRLKFNLKEFQRIVYNTKAWQRAATTENIPMGTPYYFQGPIVRRMTAEQAWDSFMTLLLGNPDAYSDSDKGLLGRVVDIDLDKTDGKTMASKIQAYEDGRKAQAARMGGSLNMAGESSMMDTKVLSYNGMKLLRASELQQPAPAGHFLREFGQSDRNIIDGGIRSGSQPQILMLMNGRAQEMLTNSDSLLLRTMMKEDLPKKQVESLFVSVLARTPTQDEKTRALAEMNASGDNVGASNLAWALINSLEFMFVQ